MAFLPQGQPAMQGNVAQMGRLGMGMGAVNRPALSGSMIKRGPNQARMDPMAGQQQNAMMQRYQGQGAPVGAPPPPNPGLGPSQPAMQNIAQSMGNMFGGYGQPSQVPSLPEMQGPPLDPDQLAQINQTKQNYLDASGQGMNQGNDPMMDRRNAIMGLYGNMGQGGNGMQRPDVMPRGPWNAGPMINPPTNQINGTMGARPQIQPRRGMRGLGPSFMQPQTQQQQQPDEPMRMGAQAY